MSSLTHFVPDEFFCPCGECGKSFEDMDFDFLLLLDKARNRADTRFNVNSSIRCEQHNEAVGGRSGSAHVMGLAVDIHCTSSRARFKILEAATKVGFHRIGVGRTFIHLDQDETKDSEVVWLYD